MTTRQQPSSSTRLVRAATLLPWVAVIVGVIGFVLAAITRSWALTRELDAVSVSLLTLGFATASVLVWRAYLVHRYRPVPAPPTEDLPRVTVVVPAFNEGRQVYDTLASLIASDYPRDRLHVIAVDDGSTDDTFRWIERAKRDFGTEAVRCEENRGKRHALYRGFSMAQGEVIVTVDSDSEVRADTLKNLVAPIVADGRVAAVAGVVRVLNRQHMIPRMLDVSFTYAFEFIRASESELGAVVCCPGALSAYRRSLIEKVKDGWLAQTIFGRPANIGEDRALTNKMLERGHRVVLQSTAVVYTDVPTDYQKLWRMLLRWARSNVRETIKLGSFVFRDFRFGPKLGIRILFVQHALSMLIAGLAFGPSLLALAVKPSLIAIVAVGSLLAASVPAAVYALCRRPKHCLWGFPYALLSAFGLAWITPLAILTPHHTGWLTRRAT